MPPTNGEHDRRPGPSDRAHAEVDTIVDRVRARVTTVLNARKDRATEALDSVADTVRRVAEPLHEGSYNRVGEYVEAAADQLDRFAATVRERDISELTEDVRGLARRQPAAFVAVGFAAGLLAARFLKSSAADRTAARRPRSRSRTMGADIIGRRPQRQRSTAAEGQRPGAGETEWRREKA